MIPPNELKLIVTKELPPCNYCARKITHLRDMPFCKVCLVDHTGYSWFKPIKNLNIRSNIEYLIRRPKNMCYSCKLNNYCSVLKVTEDCITQMEKIYEKDFIERPDTPVEP